MEDKLEKKLKEFFEKTEIKKFKKNREIFKPGEKIPGVALVKSGFVRIYSISEEGKETTLPLFKDVFVMTLALALRGEENKYFFESLSPVEMWIAPKKDLMEFVRNDGETVNELNELLLKEILEFSFNFEKIVSGDAYSKVVSIIYALAVKFSESVDGERMIQFNTPHRVLASLTGLTRETVTLQMLRLEKEDFIETRGRRIVVKKMEDLRKIVEK